MDRQQKDLWYDSIELDHRMSENVQNKWLSYKLYHESHGKLEWTHYELHSRKF